MGLREDALAAVKAAASESYRGEPTRLEAQVVAAVERHIRTRSRREHRDDLVEGWRRQPGGVDLALVDEEGRARRQAGQRAEIRLRDEVRARAVRVGMDRLPVRDADDRQQCGVVSP